MLSHHAFSERFTLSNVKSDKSTIRRVFNSLDSPKRLLMTSVAAKAEMVEALVALTGIVFLLLS